MSPRLSELFLGSQSDERLVALARAGHERAFVTIVERYRPELLALACRLCGEMRGEDVVQQAFLSAFAALRSGAEVKHLRGWLYRIVRNAAYRSRVPQCSALDGATASADTVEDVVQQRVLAMSALTEMARLPARQRQAMEGTVGGMARSEVASTMGLSEGAVRQLVHRARSTLRTAVTAVTPWPLARWFAGLGPSAPGPMELVGGAGVASSGGIMLKLGALVASGTLATGVAAVDLHGSRSHRAGHRAVAAGGASPSSRGAALVPAAVDPYLAMAAGSPEHSAGAPIVEASRSAGPTGAVEVALRTGRAGSGGAGSGTRHDGSRGPDGRSGPGDRVGSGGGSGNRGAVGAGEAGHGDSSAQASGSAQLGEGGGGGRDAGSPVGGGWGYDSGGPSGSIATAAPRRDGGEKAPSGSLVTSPGGAVWNSDHVSGSGGTPGPSDGSSTGGGSTPVGASAPGPSSAGGGIPGD